MSLFLSVSCPCPASFGHDYNTAQVTKFRETFDRRRIWELLRQLLFFSGSDFCLTLSIQVTGNLKPNFPKRGKEIKKSKAQLLHTCSVFEAGSGESTQGTRFGYQHTNVIIAPFYLLFVPKSQMLCRMGSETGGLLHISPLCTLEGCPWPSFTFTPCVSSVQPAALSCNSFNIPAALLTHGGLALATQSSLKQQQQQNLF